MVSLEIMFPKVDRYFRLQVTEQPADSGLNTRGLFSQELRGPEAGQVQSHVSSSTISSTAAVLSTFLLCHP